jgi:opacity protein-like surface antigen
MKPYHLFSALALAVCASGLQAQPVSTSPWCVTAIVGAVHQGGQMPDYRLNGATNQANASYSAGLLAGAALGYPFGNGWRAEGEFTCQSTDIKGNSFAGAAGPAGNCNQAATALALNLIGEQPGG